MLVLVFFVRRRRSFVKEERWLLKCSGSFWVVPFPLKTDDPVIEENVKELCTYYQCGRKNISVNNIVSLMASDGSEEGFIRGLLLFLILTVVMCPQSTIMPIGSFYMVFKAFLR